MPRSFAALVVGACALVPSAFAQERTVELLDLRPILDATLPARPGFHMVAPGNILLECLETDHPDRGPLVGTWRPDRSDLRSFARDVLGALPDTSGARIDLAGEDLVVLGTEEERALVRGALQDLESHVTEPLTVELYRLDAAPPSWSAVVSPSSFATWLEATGSVPTYQVRGRVGHTAYLGSQAAQAVLYDYDVEVAQFLGVTDPTISRARDSLELGVRPMTLDDGRLYLDVWGVASDTAGRIERYPLLVDSPHDLYLPQVDGTMVGTTAVVEDGGALVVSQEVVGRGTWVLRVRRERPWRPNPHHLSTHLLQVGRSWCGHAPFQGVEVSGGWVTDFAELDDPPPYRLGGWDATELATYIEDGLLEEQTDGTVCSLGHEVYLAGMEPIPPGLRARLGAIEQRLARTARIEVRSGELEPEVWRELRRRVPDPAGWLPALDGRTLLAVRCGDRGTLRGTHTRTSLVDYDVEIAQGVSMADPIVACVPTGTTLTCAPNVGLDGQVHATVNLSLAWWLGETEVVETHFPYHSDPPPGALVSSGRLQFPRMTVLNEAARVRAPSGAWSLVTASEVEGLDRVFVAVVRITVD